MENNNLATTAVVSALITIILFFSLSRAFPLERIVEQTTTRRYYPAILPFKDAYNPIDMHGYMLFNTSFMHVCHFGLEKGVTDEMVEVLPAGTLDQDFYISKLVLGVDQAPSGGNEVSACVTDGTNTMNVTLTGSQTSGVNSQDSFSVDVSEETLTLCYSQNAAGLSDKATVVCIYYYIPNE